MTGSTASPRPVVPRHAASLILLRPGATGLEVLMGRRGRTARFMPGHWVFPGGRAGAEDRRPWADETGRPRGLDGGAALLRLPRAALRETFEETGLVLGRKLPATPRVAGDAPIERAYRALGIVPAFDLLAYIGRAITPTASPIRFDARFFLADGRFAEGAAADSTELEEVGWHKAAPDASRPMSDVTRFMLSRAIAVWHGAEDPEPLYRYVNGVPRAVPPRGSRPAGR